MDVSTEIQETLGRSYNVPDDIDEEELMGGRFRYSRCLHVDADIMHWILNDDSSNFCFHSFLFGRNK